jgi:hypothetical protein
MSISTAISGEANVPRECGLALDCSQIRMNVVIAGNFCRSILEGRTHAVCELLLDGIGESDPFDDIFAKTFAGTLGKGWPIQV